MRSPVPAVVIVLGLFAGGVAVSIYGGTLSGNDPLAPILFFAGAGVALVALVSLIPLWRRSRRRKYAIALNTADAIARWRVSPEDMARFRSIDAARRGRFRTLKNYLKLPRTVPPGGFPIVVGETFLLIADRLYDFGMKEFGTPGEVTWHEGDPGFIEISTELQLSKGSTVLTLRLPVPAGARDEAAKGFAHLGSQINPHDRTEIYRKFGGHFHAAMQPDDTPYRMPRKAKIRLLAVAVFILAMVLFLAYNFLRPRTVYMPPPESAESTQPPSQ